MANPLGDFDPNEFYNYVKLQRDAKESSSVSNELGAVGRGWKAGLYGIPAALGSDWAQRKKDQLEREREILLQNSGMTQSWEDVDGPASAASYTGHLLLQSLPYMAEFATGVGAGPAIARRLGLGALSTATARTAGGVAASYPSSVGSVLSAQYDQAGTYDLPSAAALGAGVAGVNALAGPEAMIARGLPKSALASRTGRAAAGAVKSAVGEGFEEIIQQGLEEVGRKVVDTDYDVLGEEAQRRYKEAAIGGALVGGTIGGAAGGLSRRAPTPAAPETRVPEPAEDAPRELLALPAPDNRIYVDANGNAQQSLQPRGTRTGPDIPADAPAGQAAEEYFTGATPETLRPISNEDVRRSFARETGGKLDSFSLKLSALITDVLPQKGVVTVAERLQQMDDDLQASKKIKPETMERRKAGLAWAEMLLSEYSGKLDTMRRGAQEQRRASLNQSASLAQEVASPGARVALPAIQSQAEQQMREWNDRQAEVEQEEQVSAELADIKAREEGKQQQSILAARRALLQDIIDDPDTRNPNRRFIASLQRTFGKGTLPTEEEYATLRQFNGAKAAFAKGDAVEIAPPPADTQDTTLGVKERVEPEPVAAPRENKAPTPPVEPQQLAMDFESRAGRTRIKRFDKAQAQYEAEQAERAAALAPRPEQPVSSRRQGELFTPTGEPTRAARGDSTASEAYREAQAQAPAAPAAPQAEAAEFLQDTAAADRYIESKRAAGSSKTDEQLRAEHASRPRLKLRAKAAPTAEAIAATQEAAAEKATPEAREARFINRALGGGSEKPATELAEDYRRMMAEKTKAAEPEQTPQPKDVEVAAEVQRDRVSKMLDKRRLSAREAGEYMRRLDNARTADDVKLILGELNFRMIPRNSTVGVAPSERLTVEEIEAEIKPILDGWKNKPRVFVLELNDPSYDEGMRAWLEGANANNAAGVYWTMDGTVAGEPVIALFVENLRREDIKPVLFHEALGHAGLRAAYSRDLDSLLRDIYRTTPDIRNSALDYIYKYGNGRNFRDLSREKQIALATEEVIVQLSENGQLSQGVLSRIVAFVQRFLRRIGIRDGAYSDAEILSIVRRGQEATITGRRARPATAPTMAAPRLVGQNSEGQGKRAPGKSAAETELQKFVREQRTNFRDMKRRGIFGLSFGRDLVDMVEKDLKAARAFFDANFAKVSELSRQEQKIDAIMQEAATLDMKTRDALNAFLQFSTRNRAWGYAPSWDQSVKINPEAEKQFKALPDKAQKIARDVFQHGHETRKQLRELIGQAIDVELKEELEKTSDPAKRASLEKAAYARLRMFDTKLSDLNGPYAPLGRFGNFVATARSDAFAALEKKKDRSKEEDKQLEEMRQDPEHYAVFFEDTLGKAETRAMQLADMGLKNTQFFPKEDYYRTSSELPWVTLTRLKTQLNAALQSSDVGKSQTGRDAIAKIDTMLKDIYYDSLAEASARKHDLKRNNIEGANEDMLRSFASHGKSQAHYISALINNDKIVTAITDMREEAGAAEGQDKERAKAALNEILARYADSFEVQRQPLIDKALQFTSIWTLLTAPRYFILNGTQTYHVSLPYMAGRHGYRNAASAINGAYRNLIQTIKGDVAGFINGSFDVNKMAGVTADEKALISQLREQALIDMGLNYELGYWENPGNPASAVLSRLGHNLRTWSRQVEIMNRVSAGLAAYRLAKEKGDDGLAYATEVLARTHGDYSPMNAPRYFNKLPRLMTQFRKYQMIQASLLARLAHDAYKGASPEERLVARKSLGYLLGQTTVVTGLMGLPVIMPVVYMLNAAFGDDDEPYDTERVLRKHLPEELANLMARGVPAHLGVDLSQSLGMGNVFNPLPYTDVDLSSREGYEKTIIGALGPAAGLGGNLAQGLGLIQDGQWQRGIEMMMPGAIKSSMRAYRTANEGVTKESGDVLLKADELDLFEQTLQVLGFTPSQLQDIRRRQTDLREYQDYFDNRTRSVRREYTEAARGNDSAAMIEARKEWQKLQEAKKRAGFKPQPLSDLLRAPAEQRKRERNTAGGVQFNTSNRGFVERLQ